jgi:hypothetical protein
MCGLCTELFVPLKVSKHFFIEGNAHERAQRPNGLLGSGDQVLISQFVIPGRTERLPGSAALFDAPFPVERSFRYRVGTPRLVKVAERHVTAIPDDVNESGFGEQPSELLHVKYIAGSLVPISRFAFLGRVDAEKTPNRVRV